MKKQRFVPEARALPAGEHASRLRFDSSPVRVGFFRRDSRIGSVVRVHAETLGRYQIACGEGEHEMSTRVIAQPKRGLLPMFGEPMVENVPPVHPALAKGFRPFFLLAAIFAASILPMVIGAVLHLLILVEFALVVTPDCNLVLKLLIVLVRLEVLHT